MEYTIDWLETKTTGTGKEVKNATLRTPNGTLMDKISIWSDFPGWADLKPGMKVVGEIRANAKGYKSLGVARSYTKEPGSYGKPSGAVSAAKITSESVKEAQANKNSSIAFFNATNSAIALLNVYHLEGIAGESTEEFIVRWREWFLTEWREYESGDYRDKTRPF